MTADGGGVTGTFPGSAEAEALRSRRSSAICASMPSSDDVTLAMKAARAGSIETAGATGAGAGGGGEGEGRAGCARTKGMGGPLLLPSSGSVTSAASISCTTRPV